MGNTLPNYIKPTTGLGWVGTMIMASGSTDLFWSSISSDSKDEKNQKIKRALGMLIIGGLTFDVAEKYLSPKVIDVLPKTIGV